MNYPPTSVFVDALCYLLWTIRSTLSAIAKETPYLCTMTLWSVLHGKGVF